MFDKNHENNNLKYYFIKRKTLYIDYSKCIHTPTHTQRHLHTQDTAAAAQDIDTAAMTTVAIKNRDRQ